LLADYCGKNVSRIVAPVSSFACTHVTPVATTPTVPQSPQAFAAAVLALVGKALQSEENLDNLKPQVDALVEKYTGRQPSIVLKAIESRRMIYGWGSVITKDGQPVTDRQQDVLKMDEFRDVVHDFMRNSQAGNVMHAGPDVGEILDSFVMDTEVAAAFGFNPGCEGWMVGYKVNSDAVWKRVLSGELQAFSIEGEGIRTPIAAGAL
jgi:hypothetical protein